MMKNTIDVEIDLSKCSPEDYDLIYSKIYDDSSDTFNTELKNKFNLPQDTKELQNIVHTQSLVKVIYDLLTYKLPDIRNELDYHGDVNMSPLKCWAKQEQIDDIQKLILSLIKENGVEHIL